VTHSAASTGKVRTGWATRLARVAGAILLFELVSGLAVTCGPFHAVIQWSLLARDHRCSRDRTSGVVLGSPLE
jgi:hypothetical protein